MKSRRPRIVIDGMDGSGKTTVLNSLHSVFGNEFLFTREPGGTDLAEDIRAKLLFIDMHPLTEMLLFCGARVDTRVNTTAEAELRSIGIISDRGDSSTFAYQIYGNSRREYEELFFQIRSATPLPPDVYIFLDLPGDVSHKRVNRRDGNKGDRFDSRDVAYFERVRLGFKEFAKRVEQPCHFVDADMSEQLVIAGVEKIIRSIVLV